MFAAAVGLSVLIRVEDSIVAASALLAGRGADPRTVAGVREAGLLIAWPSARVATVVLLTTAAVAILRSGALHPSLAFPALLVAVPNAIYTRSLFVDQGALAPASQVGELLAPGSYYAWLLVASVSVALRGPGASRSER